MDYQPIEDYGVIGDLNTVALVGLDGSIDFMCFQITPVFGDMHNKQLYLPDTNILLTRFLSSEGVGELTDFMPAEELYEGHILIRRLTNVRGKTKYRMRCFPRFDYARKDHHAEAVDDKNILFYSKGREKFCLRLRSTVP